MASLTVTYLWDALSGLSLQAASCLAICALLTVFPAFAETARLATTVALTAVLREAVTQQSAIAWLEPARWGCFLSLIAQFDARSGGPQTVMRLEQPQWNGGRINSQIGTYCSPHYGDLPYKLFLISADKLSENLKENETPNYRTGEQTTTELVRGRPRAEIDILPSMTPGIAIKNGRKTVLPYLRKPVVKRLSESMGKEEFMSVIAKA